MQPVGPAQQLLHLQPALAEGLACTVWYLSCTSHPQSRYCSLQLSETCVCHAQRHVLVMSSPVFPMQAKELEACAAAKARLEEAFSRSMSELR